MKKQTLSQFMAELKQEGFRLNFINTIILTAIFYIGFFVAFPYLITTGISTFEAIYGTGLLFWALFSVTVYMHRLVAHKCSKHIAMPVHIWGNLGSVFALQSDTATWAGRHITHHAKEDTKEDPYSPMRSNNIVVGAMWSHFLTHMFDSPHEGRYDKNSAILHKRHPILRFFARFYVPLLVVQHIALPFAIGYAFLGGFEAGLRLFAIHFCFVALLHQITWTVNSVTHIFGQQMGKCSAKNAWWYFAPMGEGNYHSGHHMFPAHYRNGSPWYIFDPSGWMLWCFEKFGWVGKLNRKPRYEIQSRTLQNYQLYLQNRYPELWADWQLKTEEMRAAFESKVQAFKEASHERTTEAKKEMRIAYKQLLARLNAFNKASQAA